MIFVLDEVQVFDQEVAPPWPVAEKKLDLVRGGRIDLATLGRRLGTPAALAGMFEGADLLHVMRRVVTHRALIPSGSSRL
jgi:hypothetical protein